MARIFCNINSVTENLTSKNSSSATLILHCVYINTKTTDYTLGNGLNFKLSLSKYTGSMEKKLNVITDMCLGTLGPYHYSRHRLR